MLMKSSSFAAVLASMPIFLLVACGEPSTESLRTRLDGMTDEKLLQETARLKDKCRQSRGEPDKPSSPCSQFVLAEEVAESKGWCWGPLAAANSDKSWLRCEDDATRDARASQAWYAVTTSGNCREVLPQEAIGSVLNHDGQWNIKAILSADGFLDVSSRQKDGDVANIRLYPNCGEALMVYITHPDRPDALSVAVPLGFSPKAAGDYFGFDVRSCSGHSFGGGLGCMQGLEQGGRPPIRLSDGFTPCRVGGPIQYDFELRNGMIGVTCSASDMSFQEFNQKMEAAFGAPSAESKGSRLWTIGRYSAKSVEHELYGTPMRRVSFFYTRR